MKKTQQRRLDAGDVTTDDSDEDDITQIEPKVTKAVQPPSLSATKYANSDSETNNLKPRTGPHDTRASPSPPIDVPSPSTLPAKVSETEDEQSPPPKRADPAKSSRDFSSETIKKPTHRLGKIGGLKKKPSMSLDDDIDPPRPSTLSDTQSADATSTKKARHKLSKIGGKAKAISLNDKQATGPKHRVSAMQEQSNQSSSDDGGNFKKESSPLQPKGHSARSVDQAPQRSPGKISEAQANENRERLKRELEARSNAASRKKRKF